MPAQQQPLVRDICAWMATSWTRASSDRYILLCNLKHCDNADCHNLRDLLEDGYLSLLFHYREGSCFYCPSVKVPGKVMDLPPLAGFCDAISI